MELPLPGCSIAYIPKDGKKKKHELKITQQGTDPLVLAVQSQEQAEQWLKASCGRGRGAGSPGSCSEMGLDFTWVFCQAAPAWVNGNSYNIRKSMKAIYHTNKLKDKNLIVNIN